MNKLKKMGLVFLASLVMMSAPDVVNAADTNNEKTTEATTAYDYLQGDANDVEIKDVMTQSASANGVAGISFRTVVEPMMNIISVRPKLDTSSPFVIDSAMYEIFKPEKGTAQEDSFVTGFVFNVKGNITTGYYPIAFEIEYEDKPEGQKYRVDKTIDIALFGIEEETTTASDSAVSVPRIIVTGYETNPEKVMAGQEFELTIHLQNTSSKTAVTNVKTTLSTSGNEFLPTSGSSTEFIRSIGCGKTTDIVIKMSAQASLEQKPYVLTVECEYEGEKNAPYTASESISIPVYQEAKAKITDVEVMPMDIEVYSQANVMFSINNTGKTTLYNVQVTVDPENPYVQSEDSFVGNITEGSTGYADFMVTGISPTMDDGNVKVFVTYEDANGQTGTFETTIQLFVYEPYIGEYTEDFYYQDDFMMEEETSSNGSGIIWIVVVVIVVIIIIVVTVNVINKKKQRDMEEDFEDEIS